MSAATRKDGELIRDNPLRERAKRIIAPVMPWATKIGLCADDLSAASIALAGYGSMEARDITPFQSDSGKRIRAGLGLLMAAGLDGGDGELARYQEDSGICRRRFPFISGDKVDALSDRAQEMLMGLSRIDQAFINKNPVRIFTSVTATLTNPWASTLRSYAEWHGVTVGEKPKTLLSKAGDRVGRAVAGIPSTIIPEIQPLGDALVTVGNVKNTLDRWETYHQLRNNGDLLSPETRQNGKERFFMNVGFAVFNTLVVAGYSAFRYKQVYGKNST